MKFRVIFRFTDDGFAARSVDFPELNATGRTVAEAEDKMVNAIRGHIEKLQGHHKWKEPFEPKEPEANFHKEASPPRNGELEKLAASREKRR